MEIQTLNDELLDALFAQAKDNPRRRQNLDLRTSPADTSQRMLNALLPDTEVPIHRHLDTSETVVCLKGSLDEIFYEELPGTDNSSSAREFKEIARARLSPSTGNYGIQIPQGVWHTVQILEPSVILETKDGAYRPSTPAELG